MNSCAETHPPMAIGRNRCIVQRRRSAGIRPLAPRRGRGIAVGIKSGATTGPSNSTVRLLADGSVIVYAGTSDMGQGARTIFAQLAADALGAPLRKYRLSWETLPLYLSTCKPLRADRRCLWATPLFRLHRYPPAIAGDGRGPFGFEEAEVRSRRTVNVQPQFADYRIRYASSDVGTEN